MKLWLLIIFILFYSTVSRAQLCNGNLGDPLVNETFGTKDNPDIPSDNSYNYVEGCPKPGQFTINDFLFGCGGSWVPMTGDHTPGDVDGNYMLVNSESKSGVVFRAIVTGLCENMIYQYAAYITNVLQDRLSCSGTTVLPNFTFIIESLSGEVLASYNTGDIPITNEKQWKQYGLTYKTTAGINAVVLKIRTDPPFGCGNAFAFDDITFQSCGPAVNVTVDGSTEKQNVCAGYTNPFIMQGNYSSEFNNPAVQWQNSFDTGKTWKDIPGETTTTYKAPHQTSGVTEYRMTVAEKENINIPACRMRSNAIYIEVHPLPEHAPVQYISGCTGKDYSLPATSYLAFEVYWNGPNGYSTTDRTAIIDNLQFADTGLYTVKQVYDFGCADLDSFYLKVAPGIRVSTQPTHAVCEGESQILSASASGAGTFAWTPASGLSDSSIANPVASPADSTTYKVIVTNSSGCQDSAFLQVDVYKKPYANAGPDEIILSGDSALINGVVKGTAVNYSWSPPVYIDNINVMQPKVYPLQETIYTLTVNSSVGCGSATDEVNIQVFNDFFIPNSFTPNGDGKNDKFRILTYDNYRIAKFIIYNRWGTAVYSSKDATTGWDGTVNGLPQPIGTYIYYIELLPPAGKALIRRGTVLLLR